MTEVKRIELLRLCSARDTLGGTIYKKMSIVYIVSALGTFLVLFLLFAFLFLKLDDRYKRFEYLSEGYISDVHFADYLRAVENSIALYDDVLLRLNDRGVVGDSVLRVAAENEKELSMLGNVFRFWYRGVDNEEECSYEEYRNAVERYKYLIDKYNGKRMNMEDFMLEGGTKFLGLDSDTAVILALILVLVYQIVQGILKNVKDRKFASYFESSMRVNSEIRLYLKIMSDKYTEEVTEKQLPIVILLTLYRSRDSLFRYVEDIICRNNIDVSGGIVRAKLIENVNNRFKDDVFIFSCYKWKGRYLSETFNSAVWRQEILEGLLEIVFKKEGRDVLSSFLDQKFEGYRSEMLEKAYTG